MMKRSTVLAAALALLTLLTATAFHAAAQDAVNKPTQEEIKKQYDLAFEKALVLYEKADLLYEKKKLAEAAKELEAITSLEFPEGMESSDGALMQLDMHDFLAQVYIEMDQPGKAVATLEAGIKKAPPVSKQAYHLYMTYGHALKRMKKSEEALAAFEKAEDINQQLLKAEKEKAKEAGAKEEAGE